MGPFKHPNSPKWAGSPTRMANCWAKLICYTYGYNAERRCVEDACWIMFHSNAVMNLDPSVENNNLFLIYVWTSLQVVQTCLKLRERSCLTHRFRDSTIWQTGIVGVRPICPIFMRLHFTDCVTQNCGGFQFQSQIVLHDIPDERCLSFICCTHLIPNYWK